MKKLLMGNEAIALAAIAAGVKMVSGYPGTPSTEVLETVVKHKTDDMTVEWSVNEKVALEVAAGAAYCGARSMVTMKQVGLNVASDPLMSLAYVGVKGGMVVLVADDPGPISSQTEQDTRRFAKFAHLPVFDPATPEQAYAMTKAAFTLSEQIGKPVFLRPTTRVCHACATVEVDEAREQITITGFQKDPRWVIFPPLAYQRHLEMDTLAKELALQFSQSEFNSMIGTGTIGVAASGACYSYAKEAINSLGINVKLFQVGTPYPFPTQKASEFLNGLDTVLVVEELDSVIEEELFALIGETGISIRILGKKTGHSPVAGEFTLNRIEQTLAILFSLELAQIDQATIELPRRGAVLCAGCPHRASFYAVKQAMKGEDAVFAGDIGCYTLGNAKPLEMTDTCLCMGAGITVAQGIKNMEPHKKVFAFIGDSTFFHTGIAGIINAVYNQTDIVVVVLDNSTTAMTGHQPHPGIGKTMMGTISERIDIYQLVQALGVATAVKVNPFDFEKAVEAAKSASEVKGVSVIIYEAPCIALFKPPYTLKVNDRCKACNKCIREIGCPAMSIRQDKKVQIEPSLCYGCGLCTKICPFGAIEGGNTK